MKSKTRFLWVLLLWGAATVTECVLAQTAWTNPIRYYTLGTNSQLLDDCPICDRVSRPIPMTGTFGLRWLEDTSLFTRYELVSLSFHAGIEAGKQYEVTGGGTYTIGGEVALLQDIFLEVMIDDGVTQTKGLCVNQSRSVEQAWPALQVVADQTNGTPIQTYHLILSAVPAFQIRSLWFDQKSGDIRLEWEGNTGKVQVERSTNVAGPYTPLPLTAAEQSYTDPGVLTNGTRWFYLLQQ